MLIIYVDADACSVKDEILKVASRHSLQVYLVSNQRLAMLVTSNVEKIQVSSDFDATDNWICDHAERGDIVITGDILLADRCLKLGAYVVSPQGKVFTANNIGIAKSMRDLHSYLRETGIAPTYNASSSAKSRSLFLQELEKIIQMIKKSAS